MNRPVLRIIPLAVAILLLSFAATVAVAQRASVKEKNRILGTAIRENDTDAILQLLTEGASMEAAWGNTDARTAARLAAYIAWNLEVAYIDPPHPPQDRKTHLPAFRFLVKKSVVSTAASQTIKDGLLLAAARIGDLESAQILVEHGASVEARTPTRASSDTTRGKYSLGGESPLFLACWYTDRDRDHRLPHTPDPHPVVTYLINRGANPNAASAFGDLPLLTATAHRKVGTVRALLAAGADPSARDREKRSALTVAQNQDQSKQRDILIALLAPLTPRDLFEASNENDALRIQTLLRAGVDPNAAHPDSRETPLMRAAERNAADAVKALLDGGATVTPVNGDGNNALHIAAGAGSDAVVALLLDHGANPNTDVVYAGIRATGLLAGRTPLVLAIERGHLNTALLLLRRGATPGKPNQQGTIGSTLASGVMRKASIGDRKRLLGALVAKGLDLQNSPIVAYAARSRDPAWLRAVLDAGGNPNAHIIGEGPRDNEATALTMAICEHLMARADYGGEQQARPNTPNALRFKAQITAARQCFDLLIDRGANVNETERTGETALMYAVSVGAFDLTDELLKRGAKLNAADENGRTALHRTVSDPYFADERALRYLLKRGANRSRRDKHGDTPLALARKRGFKNAVALLAKK